MQFKCGTAYSHNEGKNLLLYAADILLTTLSVGDSMGWMGLLWSQGGFALGEAIYLTLEVAEALR
ncbi:hypothetical protein QT970_18175 [Microcoleus sp. herbarium8]|uniref:hypothetical protein n=1 Tax=Microcoleus sp. herbarium8 TaxID=3055436 RepID=UPI002FD1346B